MASRDVARGARGSLLGGDGGRGQHRHARTCLQFRAICDAGRIAVLVPRRCAARRHGSTIAPLVTPWLIVAGDLTPLGGMDVANHALARHLAAGGAEVHLVTHRAWPDLAELPGVRVHPVWRPLGSHLLGGPLLSWAGQAEWRRLRLRDARAVVNGGNCRIPTANWVHYLHAAYV